jgi:hypothetical protein
MKNLSSHVVAKVRSDFSVLEPTLRHENEELIQGREKIT